MIRTLLTTTALTVLLSTGAIAQDQAPAANPDTTVQPPAMDSGIGATPQSFDLSQGYTPTDNDSLASRVIGSQVYSSSGDDAEVIGDINDIVVTSDGNIAAVVIGVGGFLGVGEKNVAVEFAELQWTTASDGSDHIVLATTKDALATAPDFVWPEDASAPTPAMGDTGTPDNAIVENPDTTTDQPQSALDAPDPSQMTPLDEATLTAADIRGIGVFGQNDEQIGTIGDLVVNADGKIDAVIVDVGGFLGVGSKPVAVGFDNLQFSVDADNQRYLFLNATKEQLEKQPQFDKATYPEERDAQRMVVNPNG